MKSRKNEVTQNACASVHTCDLRNSQGGRCPEPTPLANTVYNSTYFHVDVFRPAAPVVRFQQRALSLKKIIQGKKKKKGNHIM